MFNGTWQKILKDEISKDYFKSILESLEYEYNNDNVYPSKENIFRVFNECSYEDIKVVILGQDPYPTAGNANGLAFSVTKDKRIPSSLRNIYIELVNDLKVAYPPHGDLTSWVDEGVFLLNTVLTVREGEPQSHRYLNWEKFTDKVIEKISDIGNIVFILWGNNAKKKAKLINKDTNYVIESAHPSPLSARRGFFGSRPFSKTNEYLEKNNIKIIDWQIRE